MLQEAAVRCNLKNIVLKFLEELNVAKWSDKADDGEMLRQIIETEPHSGSGQRTASVTSISLSQMFQLISSPQLTTTVYPGPLQHQRHFWTGGNLAVTPGTYPHEDKAWHQKQWSWKRSRVEAWRYLAVDKLGGLASSDGGKYEIVQGKNQTRWVWLKP